MEGNVKYKLDTKTEGKPENHGGKIRITGSTGGLGNRHRRHRGYRT